MKSHKIYAPFLGDGRKTVKHQDFLGKSKCFVPAGTFPVPVRLSTARILISALMTQRESYHSGMGSTLWILTTWCVANDIKYRLVTHAEKGKVTGFSLSLNPPKE